MSNRIDNTSKRNVSSAPLEAESIEAIKEFRDFLEILEVCDMSNEEITQELDSSGMEHYKPKTELENDMPQASENEGDSQSLHDEARKASDDEAGHSAPINDTDIEKNEYLTYIQQQLFNKATAEKKTAVAKYALEELRNHSVIRDGDTIFIDAGSSPMKVWESLKVLEGYKYKSVYTSNYLIIKDWMDNSYNIPESSNSKVIMVGNKLDRDHGAFYGDALCSTMEDPSFRPAVMFIGCAGIEFDKAHGIFYGYHGDDLEASAKTSYFKCRSRIKIILATPEKIGSAGGQVFNLLNIRDFDYESPICLITTEPEEKREKHNFDRAMQIFKSSEFMKLIKGRKIKFRWIVIDSKVGKFKYEVKLGGAIENISHMWRDIWG